MDSLRLFYFFCPSLYDIHFGYSFQTNGEWTVKEYVLSDRAFSDAHWASSKATILSSAFPFQEYISEYDYATGSITNPKFIPSTGKFDFAGYEDKTGLLIFLRNYLDSITHSLCSTLVYIFQGEESTYSAFYSSVFAEAGFLLVIHSTMMEYYLRDSLRDYHDNDFILVIDASDRSASLSYTCRSIGEDFFIPKSEVTEEAIVDRMVTMAREEFIRTFDVDVARDRYLEAMLPECCREAYQHYLGGNQRVSITLQRDEKKLKVIFSPPNFDHIYESIVLLELMKPFSRINTASIARILYRVRGTGPFAEAARRVLEKDKAFIHAEPLRVSPCEPCENWRLRLLQGRIVGCASCAGCAGCAGCTGGQGRQGAESLDYGGLLAARLREERGSVDQGWLCVDEVVDARVISLREALGPDTGGFIPAGEDGPCVEIGERGTNTVVLDPERGMLFRRGSAVNEVVKDDEIVFAAEEKKGYRYVWSARDGVWRVACSAVCNGTENDVWSYRCDAAGDEFSCGGRAALRIVYNPMEASLSSPTGAVTFSEDGVTLRTGVVEEVFGRGTISSSWDGEGRVHFANGSWYEGEVREGMCHGSGILRGTRNEVLTIGVWHNGQLTSSLLLPPATQHGTDAPAREAEQAGQAGQAEIMEVTEVPDLEESENNWVKFIDAVLARGDTISRETAARLLVGVTALEGRGEEEREERNGEMDVGFGVTLTVESRVSQIPTWNVEKVGVDKYRITTDDGDMVYLGGMKNDRLEGEGILYYKNGGKQYEGSFSQNLWNGMGKWFFPNGSCHYQGKWKNGEMDGAGMLYRPVNVEYCNSDFRKYVKRAGEKNPHLSFARGFNPFSTDAFSKS